MVSEELERNVRNICKITWNDGETDDRVSSIAENAVAHIHDLLGMPGEPAEADYGSCLKITACIVGMKSRMSLRKIISGTF